MAMDKNFDAAEAEPRIYAQWEAKGCFAAGANAKPGAEPFAIVIPPPNVTGSLHMGHALNNTLQDVLIRWKRMQGYDTLWQPGTDHAGIATQMVVERQLAEAGLPGRRDMDRDDFIAKVWEWKEQSGGTILNQLKRLGASCDWSRERFTMDEGLSAAVRKTFVEMYNKGLIYKGKRLVNWDPKFETAISDLEVENTEVPGHMWHFKYPLAGGATYEYVEKDEDGNVTLRETRDYISIATTRPETMLGDGAVAVHPDDERYAPIVGKLCEIPVGPKEHRRLIPIITDEYPDMNFGSGAVKITGAHDFNDYAVAKRGGIPMYRLMDTRAAMRADGAPYAECAARAQEIANGAEFTEAEIDTLNLIPDELRGLDRFEARNAVVAQITDEGLAVMVPNPAYAEDSDLTLRSGEAEPGPAGSGADGTSFETAPAEPPQDEGGSDAPQFISLVESKPIMQPFGDRSGVVIEPMLTDQWFCDADTLAKPALAAVKDGRTKIVPKQWETTYYRWLEDIQPWCISRQLWWGHRIPVWYGPKIENGFARIQDIEPFCAETEEAALEQAKDYYQRQLGSEFYGVEIVGEDYLRATGVQQRPEDPLTPAAPMINFEGPVQIFRDTDVLDTWFSSALWPYSTLGWPEQTPELAKYYPTSVLITGFDIIFFWVARMMMAGLQEFDEIPFHDVYVHALVRDEKGAKMSKSVGNVIDPLDLIQGIDIDGLVKKRTTGLNRPQDAPKIEKQTRAEYPGGFEPFGADALRFTLTSMAAMGRDIKLSVERIKGFRNFGTKLWNAARFCEMNGCARAPGFDPKSPEQAVNKWIIGETARIREATDAALAEYRYNDAAMGLYQHIWGVFCDWYVELAKPLLQGDDGPAKDETRATAAWALDECVTLLHPIMPFITEELWKVTGGEGVLMHRDWPTYNAADLADPEADKEMGWTISLIEAIRSVRSEMGVPPAAKIELVLTDFDMEAAQRLLRNGALIRRLAGLSEAAVANEAPDGAVTTAIEGATVNLPLAGVIDVAAETARLKKSVAKLDKEVGGLKGKLTNEKFLAKAPEEIVAEQRERLAAAEAEKAKLDAALSRLAAMS